MKYCAEYGALLDAFVDGELSAEDSARVREHLKVCGGCRSYVDAALAIRDAFPEEDDADVPEDFAAGVMAAIRAGDAPRETAPVQNETESVKTPSRPGRWKKLLLPLAACFALAVLARGILPMGGMGGMSAAADTAAAAAAPAAAPASGGTMAGGSPESAPEVEETAPTAGEPEEPADSGQAKLVNQGVLYAASTSGQEQRDAQADPESGVMMAMESGEAAADGAVGNTPAVTDAAGSMGPSAAVSLTREQRQALSGLLDGCPLVEEGPPAVYRLTESQLQAFVAELDRQDIPVTVTEPEDGETSEDCLLYITPAD